MKFDKEYSTQYTPEREYLLSVGIKPSLVEVPYWEFNTMEKYLDSEISKYIV